VCFVCGIVNWAVGALYFVTAVGRVCVRGVGGWVYVWVSVLGGWMRRRVVVFWVWGGGGVVGSVLGGRVSVWVCAVYVAGWVSGWMDGLTSLEGGACVSVCRGEHSFSLSVSVN
jgi:hypothetical protein